ncbi:hypothetical protein JCM24511_06870 [Saitozyma sp. JCM 24511]|nr:hypothetical protein JCM24511_06870 [Saitozyma sp. JCM 24511]
MPLTESWARETLVKSLETGGVPAVFAHTADDSVWTVVSPSSKALPISGKYDKATHDPATSIGRSNNCFTAPQRYEITNLLVLPEKNTVVLEMIARATTKKGKDFENFHCWVVEYEKEGEKPKIIRTRQYMDSALLAETMKANEIS